MKNIITPREYILLDEDERFYYDPQYAKYKTKKVRDYQTCDLGHEHFMGWIEERTPIGNPILYSKNEKIL